MWSPKFLANTQTKRYVLTMLAAALQYIVLIGRIRFVEERPFLHFSRHLDLEVMQVAAVDLVPLHLNHFWQISRRWGTGWIGG